MESLFFSNRMYTVREANINYYKTPFVHPRRTMADYDFIYLLEGEWNIGQEGEEYLLKEDSMLILRGGVEHYGITPCSAGTRTMYFHIEMESEEKENSFAIRPYHQEVSEKVKKRFFDVVRSFLAGNERKASAYFALLLCDLEESERYSEDSKIASRIKTRIHENPELFFTNADLARMMNVSTKTAENKFKAMYGMTIHQYILEFKVREAISYFELFPEITLKEIAHNLGFFDEYHFSKTFKRIVGKSPREWRKKGDASLCAE